ncbi:hypothetical protein CKA32_006183 [Geitlerinema sp. FC II]|nr:hypothetical protein CKA32_006183 [Geitlerinema sp. FC II]
MRLSLPFPRKGTETLTTVTKTSPSFETSGLSLPFPRKGTETQPQNQSF